MLVKDKFVPAPSVRVMINIGATFDIPTGSFLFGTYGESILNGGLGMVTGTAGPGNFYKSTIANYMNLAGFSRISEVTETDLRNYDTEINSHKLGLERLTKRFKNLRDRDLFCEGSWVVVDKSQYLGDKWFEITKEYAKDKIALGKKIEIETPFIGNDGKSLLRIPTPTFGLVDSFTELLTSDVAAIQDDNELGESGGNTMHMRQGLAKTRLLMELPIVTAGSYHYMGLTAHVGKKIEMASGPMPKPPEKKLQYMKNGDVFKGVTDKFTFLLNNCWHAFNAQLLLTKDKTIEYPRHPDDNAVGDVDLNLISLRQLRGKSGPTGVVLDIVVSQSEGVLPELTEYRLTKAMKFGYIGNDQNFALAILPEVKLSRTTIRRKIDADPVLCRALNITSEICQIFQYYRTLDRALVCSMEQLYDDLIRAGYDWKILLNSRGYWLPDNDKQEVPFLSSMDLLRMRIGLYHPYWYPVAKENLIPVAPTTLSK